MKGLLSRFLAQNYFAADAPFFAGHHAGQTHPDLPSSPAETPAVINVLSYNIFYGRNVAGAAEELAAIQTQRALDILLLQEMDETGVDTIARALSLNYAYYPAAVVGRHQRNFGNAVLTRWPLDTPQKLLLPHRSLTTRMVRTATKVNVQIGARRVVAISTHTETIFTLPPYRRAQHLAVSRAGGDAASHMVIGGDFNTLNRADVDRLRRVFAEYELARVSADGPTLIKRGLTVAADHIFAKGFTVLDAGIYAEARASDHRPLWSSLAFVG